jgi:predicted nuclease with TOPRIM domain
MYRVKIIVLEASDKEGIKKAQQTLNLWSTNKELIKYEIHTTSNHIVFNICRKK